jgi:PadR family transcriptional regulator PadR
MVNANSRRRHAVPEPLVLRLVREREMCGYELARALLARDDGAMALGEGTLYPVLHALERDGALSSTRKTLNGRSRIHYCAAPGGHDHRPRPLWTRLMRSLLSLLQGPAPLSGERHA